MNREATYLAIFLSTAVHFVHILGRLVSVLVYPASLSSGYIRT